MTQLPGAYALLGTWTDAQLAQIGRRIDQFKASIDKALEQSDLSIYSDLVEEFVKEREVAPEKVAAALAFMAQQDRPLTMPENSKPERRDSRDTTAGFNDEERPRRKERKQEDEFTE